MKSNMAERLLIIVFGVFSFMMAGVSQNKVVVLDPGHGYCMGSNCPEGGGAIFEGQSVINPDRRCVDEIVNSLEIARNVKSMLDGHCEDVDVFLTRDKNVVNDRYWEDNLRIEMRTKFAKDRNANVFVSIHSNAPGSSCSTNQNAHGAEGFVCNHYRNDNTDNPYLQNDTRITNRMLEGLEEIGFRNRKGRPVEWRYEVQGTQNADWHLGTLISNSTPYKAYMETGFHTNEHDVLLMRSNYYRKRIAWAYYRAIVEALGIDDDCNKVENLFCEIPVKQVREGRLYTDESTQGRENIIDLYCDLIKFNEIQLGGEKVYEIKVNAEDIVTCSLKNTTGSPKMYVIQADDCDDINPIDNCIAKGDEVQLSRGEYYLIIDSPHPYGATYDLEIINAQTCQDLYEPNNGVAFPFWVDVDASGWRNGFTKTFDICVGGTQDGRDVFGFNLDNRYNGIFSASIPDSRDVDLFLQDKSFHTLDSSDEEVEYCTQRDTDGGFCVRCEELYVELIFFDKDDSEQIPLTITWTPENDCANNFRAEESQISSNPKAQSRSSLNMSVSPADACYGEEVTIDIDGGETDRYVFVSEDPYMVHHGKTYTFEPSRAQTVIVYEEVTDLCHEIGRLEYFELSLSCGDGDNAGGDCPVIEWVNLHSLGNEKYYVSWTPEYDDGVYKYELKVRVDGETVINEDTEDTSPKDLDFRVQGDGEVDIRIRAVCEDGSKGDYTRVVFDVEGKNGDNDDNESEDCESVDEKTFEIDYSVIPGNIDIDWSKPGNDADDYQWEVLDKNGEMLQEGTVYISSLGLKQLPTCQMVTLKVRTICDSGDTKSWSEIVFPTCEGYEGEEQEEVENYCGLPAQITAGLYSTGWSVKLHEKGEGAAFVRITEVPGSIVWQQELEQGKDLLVVPHEVLDFCNKYDIWVYPKTKEGAFCENDSILRLEPICNENTACRAIDTLIVKRVDNGYEFSWFEPLYADTEFKLKGRYNISGVDPSIAIKMAMEGTKSVVFTNQEIGSCVDVGRVLVQVDCGTQSGTMDREFGVNLTDCTTSDNRVLLGDVEVGMFGKTLQIKNPKRRNLQVSIYTVLGQELVNTITQESLYLKNLEISTGLYLVNLKDTDSDAIYTQKIVL